MSAAASEKRVSAAVLERNVPLADFTTELPETRLRQLRLPTTGREFETLARDAASTNQTFAQFLLRLTELELATRATNAVVTRIKDTGFPVEKDRLELERRRRTQRTWGFLHIPPKRYIPDTTRS